MTVYVSRPTPQTVQIALSLDAARLLMGVVGRLGVMDIDALVHDAPHAWNRARADPKAAAVVVLKLFEALGDAGLIDTGAGVIGSHLS